MKCLDLTFPTPAENLACDEALLDWREENGGEDILRFWESPEMFVVVGYANKIAAEVNVANCGAKKIPVFRRCSGGGAVLQGRGCLNYSLILRIAGNSPAATISGTNRFIMERNREAVQSAIGDPQSSIAVRGHTDLALITHSSSRWGERPRDPFLLVTHHSSLITPKKFSGNSQRRRKNFLLFHGTFLLDFNLALIGEFLKMPSKQPDYRGSRSHVEFLMNLNLTADEVKAALQKIWNAKSLLKNPPLEEIASLAHEKYSTREWNWKF